MRMSNLSAYQQQFLLFDDRMETRQKIWDGATDEEKLELWKAMDMERFQDNTYAEKLSFFRNKDQINVEVEEKPVTGGNEESPVNFEEEKHRITRKKKKGGSKFNQVTFKAMKRNKMYMDESCNKATLIQMKYWRQMNRELKFRFWFSYFDSKERVKIWNQSLFSKTHLLKLAKSADDPLTYKALTHRTYPTLITHYAY